MSTLILYATKYGATAQVAQLLADQLVGATVVDLAAAQPADLQSYQRVIIGSPVTAGMIKKEVKAFIQQQGEELASKQLHLFLCGLDPSKQQECFTSNFSTEFLETVKSQHFVGGIFDPQKCGFFSRGIIKKVAGLTEYTDRIDHEEIAQLVELVKGEEYA